MTKFNEASYRTPCGKAGYIVIFDGSAAVIVAYEGVHGDDFMCDECQYRQNCPVMEYSFMPEQHVCGWDEADALLGMWEYEPTPNESEELDELLKII